MSKAFTKDDDDAGFLPPPTSRRAHGGHLTPIGARLMTEAVAAARARLTAMAPDDPSRAIHEATVARYAAILAAGDVLPPGRGDEVALGAEVRVREAKGPERTVVIVTPDEVGVVPGGCSATSPIGHALLGARVGDEVEIRKPAGTERVTVKGVRFRP